MNHSRAKVDIYGISNATHFAKQRGDGVVKDALRFMTDPERDKRVGDHECKTCYYLCSRLGGAAMTSRQCGLCDVIMQFGSTVTDSLCGPCAETNALCKCCTADIDLIQRRTMLPRRRRTRKEKPHAEKET